MFKSIAAAIAAAFSAVADTISQGVRGAWEMSVVNGKRVWTWVQPAIKAGRRAAVAMQPAFDVARDIATLPLRVVGAVFAGPPSAAATQSHEQAVVAKAEQAASNYREIEIAEPPRMVTAGQCARQQAESILDPRINSPYVGHLTAKERAWIWGIDNQRRALAVSSS